VGLFGNGEGVLQNREVQFNLADCCVLHLDRLWSKPIVSEIIIPFVGQLHRVLGVDPRIGYLLVVLFEIKVRVLLDFLGLR
jgi:hypothetical protein